MTDHLLACIPEQYRTSTVCGLVHGMSDTAGATASLLADELRDAGMDDANLRQVFTLLVCGEPAWDGTRLAFAGIMEDHGEGKRAEFVRLQVELSRLKKCRVCIDGPFAEHEFCDWCKIHQRERMLWGSWPDTDDMRTKIREECPAVADWVVLPESLTSGFEPSEMRIASVARGFISSIRCDWQTWLRCHDAIFWSPAQKVECPKCKGEAETPSKELSLGIAKYDPCECRTGRIPRPMTRKMRCGKCNGSRTIEQPSAFGDCKVACSCGTGYTEQHISATCQPLERIAVSEIHPSHIIEWGGGNVMTFVLLAGHNGTQYRFTRMKCRTCEGRGRVDAHMNGEDIIPRGVCPSCHGATPNEWECDAWPGVVFEMPEAN